MLRGVAYLSLRGFCELKAEGDMSLPVLAKRSIPATLFGTHVSLDRAPFVKQLPSADTPATMSDCQPPEEASIFASRKSGAAELSSKQLCE